MVLMVLLDLKVSKVNKVMPDLKACKVSKEMLDLPDLMG